MKTDEHLQLKAKDIRCIIFLCASFFVSFILSRKRVYELIGNFVVPLEDLITFVLPIFLAILPIIIAIATLVYQIYYNRYTLKDFKLAVKSEFIWLAILLALNLFFIFIFWLTKAEFTFLFFEILLLLIFVITKFVFFLLRYNKFSIEGYVNKYTSKCISVINSNSFDKEKIRSLLRDINEYFSESIEKKENNYIRLIIL